MLHGSFGQLFIKALHDYLTLHQYSVSRPEYLSGAIQNVLDQESEKPGNLKVDMYTVLSSWTDQVGYPVVNVSFENKKLIFSQVS